MRFLKHRAIFYLGLVVFLVLLTGGTTMKAFAGESFTESLSNSSVSAALVTLI